MARYFWENILLSWDIFVVISVIPSIILVPYQASFNASVVWHWPVIYIGDFIYIISLLLMFFRSYTNSRGEVVTDQKLIMKYYLRTSFIYDFLSVIPFEMIAIVGNSDDIKYVVAILRLNRILRLHRVWTFLCKFSMYKYSMSFNGLCCHYIVEGGVCVISTFVGWRAPSLSTC